MISRIIPKYIEPDKSNILEKYTCIYYDTEGSSLKSVHYRKYIKKYIMFGLISYWKLESESFEYF